MPDQPDALDRLLDTTLEHVRADEPPMTAAEVRAGKDALLETLRTCAAAPGDVAAAGGPSRGRAGAAARGPGSHRARRTPWLVAAAAVAVLTAGGLAVQTVDFTGTGAQHSASAAERLNRAADLAAGVSDQPVGPGQYRYVRSRYQGITLFSDTDEATVAGIVNERWIPTDPHQDWLERQADDGPATWVPGHEGTGTAPGNPAQRNGDFRAPCGDFAYLAEGQPDRCTRVGWDNPTPDFLATLPTDPEALYRRMRDEGGDGDAGVLVAAREGLSSGMLPAEYRARVFRALANVPNLQVTDERANLDGKVGVALGLRVHGDFTEIIVDPADGSFIGWREVVAEDDVLAGGTVRQSSATTTGVADALGAPPRK